MPIIAVSADALAERRSAAMTAGCDAYVTKPIDFDELLSTLNGLLASAAAEAPPMPVARATTRQPSKLTKPRNWPIW